MEISVRSEPTMVIAKNTAFDPNELNQEYVWDIIIEYPAVRYTLVALHIVGILLASIGNGVLMFVVIKRWRKNRSNVTAYLVLNLVSTEFIRTVFHQPMRLIDILQPGNNHRGFSDLAFCKTSGFFSAFFAGVAFHTIVGISLERLMLICYPLQAKGLLTVNRTRAAIGLIWIFAFFAMLPLPMFFTFVVVLPVKEKNVSFCLIDVVSDTNNGWIYYIMLFVLYYALPVIAISISYSRIFYTLNKGMLGTDPQDIAVRRILSSRKTLAKIMLSIAVIFTLFQGPYFVTFLCLCLGLQVPSNPIFLLLVIEFLPLISSVLNPLVYSANSTSWRKGLLSFGSGGGGGGGMSDEVGGGEFKRGDTVRSSITKFRETFRIKTIEKEMSNGKALSRIMEGQQGPEGTHL